MCNRRDRVYVVCLMRVNHGERQPDLARGVQRGLTSNPGIKATVPYLHRGRDGTAPWDTHLLSILTRAECIGTVPHMVVPHLAQMAMARWIASLRCFVCSAGPWVRMIGS
jgi:hypothetical protein